MTLYKYVGFEAGLKILQNNTLGFAYLDDFNDPFELTGLIGSEADLQWFYSTMRPVISRKFAILCLTSNPLNPLMWSHYGESYKGMVIGIDVDKAGLGNSEEFFIPYTSGKITYKGMGERTVCELLDESIIRNILGQSLSKIDRDLIANALLLKGEKWSYEEEVRVVKEIQALNVNKRGLDFQAKCGLVGGGWTELNLGDRKIYSFKVPSDSIVEVYIGHKTKSNQSIKALSKKRNVYEENKAFDLTYLEQTCFQDLKALCNTRDIDLFEVQVNLQKWSLRKKIIK